MTTTPQSGAEAPKAPAPGTPEYDAAMAEKFRTSQSDVTDALAAQFGNAEDQTQTQQPADQGKPQRPENVPEKFWDAEKGEVRVEELLKSYTHLESTRGQQQQTQTPPEGEQQGEAQAAVEAAGLDWATLGSKIEATGTIDESDFAALEKAGIPKDLVERHIALLHREREAATNEAYAYGGGEEATKGLLDWAAKTLPKDQIEGYNAMLASPNWKVALDTLKSLKAQSSPTAGEPKLQTPTGLPGGTSTGFATEDDMKAAMRDPRYFQMTPEGARYRADVQEKVRLAAWRR